MGNKATRLLWARINDRVGLDPSSEAFNFSWSFDVAIGYRTHSGDPEIHEMR